MVKDLTVGKPWKLILFFAIPLFIGNLFQQLYSMADTFIVGRTLGVDALAAVGCTGSISFFIIGFTMGVTNGLAIITARCFGANDEQGVKRSFAVSIIIAFCVAVFMTAVSMILCRPFLELLQTPSNIIDDAYRYIIVIFGGILITVLYNLLSAMIRALGDSKTPLYFLIFTSVCNIGLDYLFILVFQMGVAGAAYATILSQFLSAALCIVFIAKKFPMLHIQKKHFKIDRAWVAEHLRISLPMGFQMSIISIGSIILQAILNGLGSDAVAAFTAAQKIDGFATLPLVSFGTTMATYSAQNNGAGQYSRIRKGIFQCLMMSIAFALLMAVIMTVFGEPISLFFVGSGEVEIAKMSAIYLTVNGCTYWILSCLFTIRNSLQGLGKSLVPTLAGFAELVMRAFAALVLGQLYGFTGIAFANPLAWLGAMVPLGISFYLTLREFRGKSDTPREAEQTAIV